MEAIKNFLLKDSSYKKQIILRAFFGTIVILMGYVSILAMFPKDICTEKQHSEPFTDKDGVLKTTFDDKVALVLFDGLGSRFVFENDTYFKPEFKGMLVAFEELSKSNPKESAFIRSQVYPPTITTKQVAALITGGYPLQSLSDSTKKVHSSDSLLMRLQGDNYFFGDRAWEPFLISSKDVKFKKTSYDGFFSVEKPKDDEENPTEKAFFEVTLFDTDSRKQDQFFFVDNSSSWF